MYWEAFNAENSHVLRKSESFNVSCLRTVNLGNTLHCIINDNLKLSNVHWSNTVYA